MSGHRRSLFGGEDLPKEVERGSPSVALGGKQQHHLRTCHESGSWGVGGGGICCPRVPRLCPTARVHELQALVPHPRVESGAGWDCSQGLCDVPERLGWVVHAKETACGPPCSPFLCGGTVGSLAPLETQLLLLAAGPRARRYDQGGGDRAAGPVVSFRPLPWAPLLPSHPHAPTRTPASGAWVFP